MIPNPFASRRGRPASPSALALLLLMLACPLLPARVQAHPAETGWPRLLETSRGHSIVVYEPRVTSFEGRVLTASAAASIQPPGDGEPTFGAIWFTAELEAGSDGRAVRIARVEVTRAKFPESTPRLEETVAAIVERELPGSNPWSLDRIYAGLEADKNERAAAATIRNDAPEIFVSTAPAVLLVYQGEPQARRVPDTDLSRIVNTGHFVVYDGAGRNYYLAHGPYWYRAKDALGPWEAIANPPSRVAALEPEDPGEGPRDGRRLDAAPEVVSSAKPAELIVFDGKPQFETVEDTDLLVVVNSDKDVLRDVESQKYFVLLSGRWFTSPTLDGPWTFVPSDRLPETFADIPRGSEIAHLRASVAGTPEAEEAVLSAHVPKIEAIDRDERGAFRVIYDGAPEFRRIKGTDIAYAVNTETAVFRQEDRYYACEDGVWYVSDEPEGPWRVSDARPKGLEELPAENPHYHTKYVYIYDSSPDVVYVGYTPGYFGCYPYWGSVVYGTGWYYHPWGGYPYYPYPATWGFGITYWGGWGFGFYGSWGYPYYGYPFYYRAFPVYHTGYYGPGGYYPRYHRNYGTSRTRTTVTDREWSRYPGTKGTAMSRPTLRRAGDRTLGRSGTGRDRSAEEALTRRSSGDRGRTLSERAVRPTRGSSIRERVLRGPGGRAGSGSRSRDVYRPRVNGRSYEDGRVLRGGGRSEDRGGRTGWSGGRPSGSYGGRSGWSGGRGGGRAGAGGMRSSGGGGGRSGSYGGARRR